MSRERVECVVVGAGVVGLAIARGLALAGREVVVIERNAWIGNETSSRSNEVVHAGFLYPPKSLRGRLCRPGAVALSAYCRERRIDLAIRGKLVIASNGAEATALKDLAETGKACGVRDLELLSPGETARMAPGIRCAAALYSPSTAVVDSHALMLAFQGDAEDAGTAIAFDNTVTHGTVAGSEKVLTIRSRDGTDMELASDILINAAGLGAGPLARRLEGLAPERVPHIHLSKGNFLACAGEPPFDLVIVPMGTTLVDGGAFTIDTGGRGKFGPDQAWVEKIDYRVPDGLETRFGGAIRRYLPSFDVGRLAPDYAGIRPRSWGPGDEPGDWIVDGPAEHGIDGLVNLYGIETPGLTASLAIADHVVGQIEP